MWPGVHPRLGWPLVLGGAACYGWLLAALHPRAAVLWWGLIGFVVAVDIAIAVRAWRRDSRIAEALAGRSPAGPGPSDEVDRVARRVDDQGVLSVWAPSLAVFFIASTGLQAALDRGNLLFAVPLAGVLLYAVLATMLLRRRNRQVRRWLAEHPRTDGWRSVPPT